MAEYERKLLRTPGLKQDVPVSRRGAEIHGLGKTFSPIAGKAGSHKDRFYKAADVRALKVAGLSSDSCFAHRYCSLAGI